MEQNSKTVITIETIVDTSIEKVWKCWTTPEDIIQWNYASDDWHTPAATNNLYNGGTFSYRMEAKDGCMGFDFAGVYDNVIEQKEISYTIGDGRKVKVLFSEEDNKVKVVESFEAENVNPEEMQRKGWQNILDNFKKYTEGK